MRKRLPDYALFAAALLLASCGSETKPTPASESPKQAQAPKPTDESSRFPRAGLRSTMVVPNHLLDKNFMPGGTLAHYKADKTEFDLFAVRLPSAQDAAFLLPDWNKALAGSKLVPSFGGYFGKDGTRPVFVFAKGAWVAGVAGLPEKDADLQARALAAALN